MDNFTHSLTGWALGQTGLKSKSRKGLAALVLGANLPDIDVFFGGVDWAPLAVHRGFTHGLVGGVLVLPPLLAVLLWLFDRWQVRIGEQFASGLPMRFGWLLALCYIGTATHPLLDLQNTYAIQLFSPFSDSWFHTDGLFIIDVWVWSLLAVGIALSRSSERAGGAWRRPAQAALLAVVAYIGVNLGISQLGKRALATELVAAPPDVVFAGHVPVQFWKREMIWRRDGMIGRADYDPIAGLSRPRAADPDGMDQPLAQQARRANRDILDFMRWSILPTARIERERCRARVRIGDARFGSPRLSARFVQTVELPLGGPGCPDLAKSRRTVG